MIFSFFLPNAKYQIPVVLWYIIREIQKVPYYVTWKLSLYTMSELKIFEK